MVFFRVLFKKILYKIPLKTLLLLGIFLMLAFFIFGSEVFATEPNLSDFENCVDNIRWCIAYNGTDYYLINALNGSHYLLSLNVTNNNGVYTSDGRFRCIVGGGNIFNQPASMKYYKFNYNTNLFELIDSNTQDIQIGFCTLLYSQAPVRRFR